MSVYEIITNKIIEELESGSIAWKRGWKIRYHKNFVSKKPYRGINVLLLAMRNRSTPYWLTFNQAKAKGGTIRKGEKSTIVVFHKWIEEKDTDTGEVEKYPVLRYYRVFNLDQTEGIEIPKDEEAIEFNSVEAAEQIVDGYVGKPTIGHGGYEAYYSPTEDRIQVPNKTDFNSVEEYYGTLFHEFGHSTGHEKRLKREGVIQHNSFGSPIYSKEELVAEMTSAFLCADAGIANDGTTKNTVAYIQGWLKALQNDKRLVIIAAGQAQKAVDHIKGVKIEAETN